jgi:peptidoglycan/xylan/chitin deacetylase (PgdA/CDA1 family)/WD40 repeat protein
VTRLSALAVFLSILPSLVFSEVQFADPDISPEDRLLFRADADHPGYGKYGTLFWADLEKRSVQQLTFFPEQVALLRGRTVLQIQNRYGVFRSNPDLKGMRAVDQFPSFARGSIIQLGKVIPMQTSPDGRYLLYLRPTSPAFADLVLSDSATGTENVLSSEVEISLSGPPSLWSEDSEYVVYAKGGSIYYYSLAQLKEKRVLSEGFRRIGEGTIANVRWGNASSLYYVWDTLVYQVDSREFFTRALYAGFLKIGTIVGKIPFSFDPNFDSFWVSPDGTEIILAKSGRNVFLYVLQEQDYLSTGSSVSLPYLYLPRNTMVSNVLWSRDDVVTVLARSIAGGVSSGSLYRLTPPKDGQVASFVKAPDEGVRDVVLSPLGAVAAVVKADGVAIRTYATWEQRTVIPSREPLHALWLDETRLVVAGAAVTEVVDIGTGASALVTVSQPGQFGFSRGYGGVSTTVKGTTYRTKAGADAWTAGDVYDVENRSVVGGSYRVYLENVPGSAYGNMVMMRDIKGYGTLPLMPTGEQVYEPFPILEEPPDFDNFLHGSRIRRREVALVFNGVDSMEGLTPILNILAEYGIRCTFFVNGELIRRYPAAVKEIADSGHEAGSLFFANFDMTDSRFQVDRDFVKGGLARNEDEYFNATGRDLSLYWHAPLYLTNSTIIQAAKEMNYTYIGRDVDALDWVTRRTGEDTPGIYMSAGATVERIMKLKKPGSIIATSIGVPEGGRDDYLFQRLDVLVDSLLKNGYQIVPVSTLIEHSR